jgi:hypothetical protein
MTYEYITLYIIIQYVKNKIKALKLFSRQLKDEWEYAVIRSETINLKTGDLKKLSL